MVSPGCPDMDKSCGAQSTRRTAARASLNVSSGLWYHAAASRRSAVAQYLMIAAEAQLISQTHHPQRLGHGVLARGQHSACHQDQNTVPDQSGEARAEHRRLGDQCRWDQMRVVPIAPSR